jgi:hypothetical protein
LEAVAAGLFAVLGRKRGKVSGQVREEPDQLSCLQAVQRFTSLLLLFFLLCLSGNDKTRSSADHQLRARSGHTPSESSTQPQWIELVVGSQQTNFSLQRNSYFPVFGTLWIASRPSWGFLPEKSAIPRHSQTAK